MPDHDTQIQQIEQHAEQIFSKNPNDLKEVFKDLDQLRQSESPEQFAKDLEAINARLHQDGWLPTMEIVMTPKGGFMLRRQSDSEWQKEQELENQQYNDSSYAAPAPTSPGGFNSGYSPTEGASRRGGYARRATYNPNMRGDSGRFRYNPNISGPAAKRIVDVAKNDVGQQLWRGTNHGASGANLGCAASVSTALREAGVSRVSEMECHRLQAALQKEGWTITNTPSPGDVVFGYGGVSRAHVGIVGENGTVFDNHSSTGQWSQDSLSYFSRWNQNVFLHPPQADNTPKPQPAAVQQPAAVPAG
ncbi:MAG: hypothetical protein JSS83_08095 [Cyanobacteria bacterium SZAS LIN-3]|nr:hypothetical protein [Cyanobacteria bacterium SZAS LIN-3]